MEFLFKDPTADIDTTITNVDAGAGDQLFNFCVTLAAERTHREIGSSCHWIVEEEDRSGVDRLSWEPNLTAGQVKASQNLNFHNYKTFSTRGIKPEIDSSV